MKNARKKKFEDRVSSFERKRRLRRSRVAPGSPAKNEGNVKRKLKAVLMMSGTIWFALRWGAVFGLTVLLLSTLQAGAESRRAAEEITDQLYSIETQRDYLKDELRKLSDPELRLDMWKGEYLRYSPGERYIIFVEE